MYGDKGIPPTRYRFRPKKDYFMWKDETWRNFLKRNFGVGNYYVYFGGGFYLSGFVICRKGNKIKIKKKLNGIILQLFLGEVN
jgi:hypothetical protein